MLRSFILLLTVVYPFFLIYPIHPIAKERRGLVRLGRRLSTPACGAEWGHLEACEAQNSAAIDACADAHDACYDALDTCIIAAETTHTPPDGDVECPAAFCTDLDVCNDAYDTCYDAIDPTCDAICLDEVDAYEDCMDALEEQGSDTPPSFLAEYEDPTEEPAPEECYCPEPEEAPGMFATN